ncbi:hypothetical protein, partial [Pseudomonas aeruginosa]
KPQSIDASRYPAYLEAVHSGRAIDAHNAQRDPRTQELYKDYLKPLGVVGVDGAPAVYRLEVGGVAAGVDALGLPVLGEVAAVDGHRFQARVVE